MSSPQLRRLVALMQRSVAPVYATWNSSDKGSAITLSNGNLTTAQTTAAGLVRATIGKISGKWQWQVTPSTSLNQIGAAKSGAATSNYVGGDSNGYGIYAADGKVYTNNTPGSVIFTYSSGDVITMLLDMDAGHLSAKKNGGSAILVQAGIGGALIYPAWGDSGSADGATANFGATPLSFPEAGYNLGIYN